MYKAISLRPIKSQLSTARIWLHHARTVKSEQHHISHCDNTIVVEYFLKVFTVIPLLLHVAMPGIAKTYQRVSDICTDGALQDDLLSVCLVLSLEKTLENRML